MQFKTERKVGKVGVMLIGLGGNNGWYVDAACYIILVPIVQDDRLNIFLVEENTSPFLFKEYFYSHTISLSFLVSILVIVHALLVLLQTN